MSGLTPKQYETLTFISEFIAANGFSPNYNEIAAAAGITSRGEVHRRVHSLVERGKITMLPHRARSIALVERAAA